ncbi:MAG: sodium ion-translocating decarboxylase subunit beta [Candidatus Cryosericum sp.]
MEELLHGIVGMADWRVWVMFGVGLTLIWLAVKKEYEPNLLLPMGFGCLLANIPFSSAVNGGFLDVLFKAGIANELFPILIFIAVGAMIDFGPLLQDPEMLFFGAAAQFGIFFTMMLALLIGRIPGIAGIPGLREAAAIGIIGAADGPTSIYVATRFAPLLLAPITVAAYSYMSLVPIIQPPVIRALTTREERMIRMDNPEHEVSRSVRIAFPIVVTMIAGIIAPMSVALIGSLMFGNLLRESGVTERLSKTAQGELASLVTILLGITIGSSMNGKQFLNFTTLLIIGMGLIAFVFDTAGGVLFAKLINLFRKKKINPMIGACGISAFPMSARVIQKMAQQEDGSNFIIMHAVGANVAGQVASIIAGGLILALVR